MTFRVLVSENSHYMDEGERYEHGTFASADEALAAAKKIVDDFLLNAHKPAMSAQDLFKHYTMFGEDPFIVSAGGTRVEFSAWNYARERCAEICR